ncbi:hypothetical protein [Acetobacter cibinongensis]|uniref:hypothetical protein n=1 Tax=Acetobacter cibinongensis TaxID=146475 RepID=UPI000A3C19D2|nr:hypothetical protein [Acetobacter cibinongensis]
MTDTPKTNVAVNAAKIGGITAVVPLLFSAIPEPWSTVVASLIIICGGIAAAVPAPTVGSKWTAPYKLVSVIGLNFGWAINHISGRVNASQGPVAQDSAKNKPSAST